MNPKNESQNIMTNGETGEKYPLKILLVEDNIVNKVIAGAFLKKLGYTADIAENGIEALQALHEKTYDVIMMDIQMPEMNGEETTRKIRSEWPENEQPRIIAMTANCSDQDKERYRAAGMDDFIGKPLNIEELLRALRDCRTIAVVERPSPYAGKNSGLTVGVESPVNPDVLREFQNLMGDDGYTFAAELVNIFLRDSLDLIKKMKQSILAKDTAGLGRAAHTLKGNSNQVGAHPLAAFCSKLEQSAAAGRLDETDLIVEIESEFFRVKENLEQTYHID